MKNLQFGFFKIGKEWCAAAWTAKGLSALVLPRKNRQQALRGLHEYLPPLPAKFWDKPPTSVPKTFQTQTRMALAGKRFHISGFEISFLTPFQQRILKATCQIPWGQVRTYGWVAAKAGSPKGFRAAGQALNRNPIPVFIPCHRVISSGSKLGGYGGGVDWKVRLLKNEGITAKQGIVS
jgi:methylated-DNA-[protein]-cysteine S-methyltransferase